MSVTISGRFVYANNTIRQEPSNKQPGKDEPNALEKTYNETKHMFGLGLVYGLSTKFHYVVAFRFIGGGNMSTRSKPQTCRKSLTNFIT